MPTVFTEDDKLDHLYFLTICCLFWTPSIIFLLLYLLWINYLLILLAVDLWGKFSSFAEIALERIIIGRAAADQRNFLSPSSLIGYGFVACALTSDKLLIAKCKAKNRKSEYF